MARWKMLAGKFYYGGKKYVAGDIFEAPPFAVRGIRDILQALDRIEEYEDFHPDDVPRRKLKAIHRGYGKWDVYNTEMEKNVNDHPLTKMEAFHLVEELEEKEAVDNAQQEERMKQKAQAALDAERKALEEEQKEPVEEEKPKPKKKGKEVGVSKDAAKDAVEEDDEEDPTLEEETRDTKAVGRKRRVPIGRRPKSE